LNTFAIKTPLTNQVARLSWETRWPEFAPRLAYNAYKYTRRVKFADKPRKYIVPLEFAQTTGVAVRKLGAVIRLAVRGTLSHNSEKQKQNGKHFSV